MKFEIKNFNISASSLGCFFQCQRKWAHQYLYRSPRDEVDQKAMKIGIAMHSLLEEFYKKELFDNKQWLVDNWKAFYMKELLSENKEDLATGYEALDKLYGILQQQNWLQPAWKYGNKKGIEIYFKFPFHGNEKYVVNLTGKIDLLLKRDKELCVIDWKTGKSVKYQVNNLNDSLQLILYSVALKKVFDVEDESLFLVYFYADKVQKFKVTNQQFQILKEKVNDFLHVYHTKKFAKTVNSWQCGYCEYRSVCQGKTGTIML